MTPPLTVAPPRSSPGTSPSIATPPLATPPRSSTTVLAAFGVTQTRMGILYECLPGLPGAEAPGVAHATVLKLAAYTAALEQRLVDAGLALPPRP